MRRHVTIAIVASMVAAPLVVSFAHAQEATPFRAGQWGAEFSVGNNGNSATGAGVLRFLSPRTALTIDLTGHVSRTTGEGSYEQAQSEFTLRSGPRWYRSLARNVVQHLSLGAVVSYASHTSDNGTARTTGSGVGAGAFGELGGTWLVTSQFGLGAAWQANVLFSHGKQTTVPASTTTIDPYANSDGLSANLGILSLRASVFF